MVSNAATSSLLWGLVGGMCFLVLVQGYELLAEPLVGISIKAGVTILVAGTTAATAHVARPRLPAGNR